MLLKIKSAVVSNQPDSHTNGNHDIGFNELILYNLFKNIKKLLPISTYFIVLF